jgi:NhaP-type Na+/H+ or K+/H+ antiporter
VRHRTGAVRVRKYRQQIGCNHEIFNGSYFVSLKSTKNLKKKYKIYRKVMESMIFIILGVMLVNQSEWWAEWNTAFSVIALLACIIVRFAGL